MIESVETKEDQTIYWLKGNNPRVGIIVSATQNCATDEIASGFDLAYDTFGKALDGLEEKK